MSRIVCIGDSLTYGYGVSKKAAWVYRLSERLCAMILNKGVNGDTTSGMLSRSFRDVIGNEPSYVIIMGGTNDFLKGYSLTSVCSNISILVKEALQYSIIPIVGCPIPVDESLAGTLWSPYIDYLLVNEKLSLYKEWIICQSSESGLKYIDFHSKFIAALKDTDNKGYYTDGIHPNEAGHMLMEECVLESGNFNDILL